MRISIPLHTKSHPVYGKKVFKKYADEESGQFAQSILDDLRVEPSFEKEYNEEYGDGFTDIDRLPVFAETMKFKELHGEFKALLREYIHREVSDYWELHQKIRRSIS